MNAQSIRKKVNRLNEMILAGNVIEAFQEFYHPAVVMQENTQNPTVGFEENLAREKDFVAKVKWNLEKVLGIIVDEENNRSIVEWELDTFIKNGVTLRLYRRAGRMGKSFTKILLHCKITTLGCEINNKFILSRILNTF